MGVLVLLLAVGAVSYSVVKQRNPNAGSTPNQGIQTAVSAFTPTSQIPSSVETQIQAKVQSSPSGTTVSGTVQTAQLQAQAYVTAYGGSWSVYPGSTTGQYVVAKTGTQATTSAQVPTYTASGPGFPIQPGPVQAIPTA